MTLEGANIWACQHLEPHVQWLVQPEIYVFFFKHCLSIRNKIYGVVHVKFCCWYVMYGKQFLRFLDFPIQIYKTYISTQRHCKYGRRVNWLSPQGTYFQMWISEKVKIIFTNSNWGLCLFKVLWCSVILGLHYFKKWHFTTKLD